MQTNDQKFYEGTNGSAVLLIHGITSGAAQMIPMAKFLNDYGYSVWSETLPDTVHIRRICCIQPAMI